MQRLIFMTRPNVVAAFNRETSADDESAYRQN